MNTPSASLEDCHTNVLALTELSGLKWRRLTTAENYVYGTDLDQDPILNAYSRCVRENVLCTWRRRQRQETSTNIENMTLRLDTPKELWIFWYSNDEPELIKILTRDNGLIATEDTDFSDASIRYETRTQFFKALHNVLEKNMLKSGYIRFGRWFTRPLDDFAVSPDCALPAYIHGLRFEFAVQGENHVCATVKTQCQPPILRLNSKHLQLSGKPLPVILAPWSIKAFLMPQQPLRDLQNTDQLNSNGFSLISNALERMQPQLPDEVQATVDEQWAQWSATISMASTPSSVDDLNEQNENLAPSVNGKYAKKMPRFVVVEVDGVRMFYPTCFVGIVVQDPSEHTSKTEQVNLMCDDLDLKDSLIGFSQDSQIDLLEIQRQKVLALKKKETFVPEALRHSRRTQVGVRIARRSFEDASLAASPAPLSASASRVVTSEPSTSSASTTSSAALQKPKTETGLHLSMPSTSTSTTSSNSADDLRWNYFDYLRKEYCYCSMCSAGGSLNGSTAASDNQTAFPASTHPKHRKNSGSSGVPVFHRANFNDQFGLFGTHSFLFSPPQRHQKVESSKQMQKDLDVLRQLDEKERALADAHESKVSVFARTIPVTQRTAIPSDRLNFASVQECNFNNLYKRHLSEIGFPLELHEKTGYDFEPFTPITCVTPDLEVSKEFSNPDNQWHEQIRKFNYLYNPQNTDFINNESYHVNERRKKPTGPRRKVSSAAGDNACETQAQSSSTFIQNSSLLKRLLEAPDGVEIIDNVDCPRSMRRVASPGSLQAEEQQWTKCVGEALSRRRKLSSRRWASKKEEELRRQRIVSSKASKSSTRQQNQMQLLTERSHSIGDLRNPPNLSNALRLSPSATSPNLSTSLVEENKSAEVDPLPSDSRHANSPLRDQTLNLLELDPITRDEEYVADKEFLETFYAKNTKDRYLLCEHEDVKKSKRGLRPRVTYAGGHQPKDKLDSDYYVFRRLMQEDLVEVDDPKTPISNLNSSLNATQVNFGSFYNSQDLQQMFTSTQTNDMHSILSPPASNEQVDANPLASTQQHTPGDKNQAFQAQSLVPIGQTSLTLHASGWNTVAVPISNTMHDSLNIIYPTPPTPLQQFSPLNINLIIAEDPQAKRRRLADGSEVSETEQDTENMKEGAEMTELKTRRAARSNGFLALENLTGELLKSAIYAEKQMSLLPYGERLIGDLLDERIEPRKRMNWLRHLKKEPNERCLRLKEEIMKRSRRRRIALPPEYVCQFKSRLFGLTNPHDIQKLAENAIELAAVRRKPITSYGCSAVNRLNQMYQHERRQWEVRQFMISANEGNKVQMVRQFNTSGAGGILISQQMHSQQMSSMYNQPRMPFNPYMIQQQQQQQFGTSMTPQQQMVMASGQHIVGQQMPPMARMGQGQFSNAPMHPNGLSPGYITGTAMQQGNFNRMSFNSQQARLGGHGSPMAATRYPAPNQTPSQQMLGYFNNPSPASSLSSNISQHDPSAQQAQRPGSVVVGPASVPGQIGGANSVHAPLPFGSPGLPMVGSAGGGFQRTPSMPPSVTTAANNLDLSVNNQSVFSVENPSSALVGYRLQMDQAKVDEVLSLFQNSRSRVIAVLMKDTILDLHYDSVFDACPICSCNANIRSAELGLYIQTPPVLTEVLRIQQRQQQDPTFKTDYWSGLLVGNTALPCSCGFSAVRHRFLCSDGRGLFADDVQEAGATLSHLKSLGRGNERSWTKKRTLNELMDCLRFLSLNRNLATCFKQAYYLGDFPTEDIFFKPNPSGFSSNNSNYVVSRVDMDEIDVAVRSAIQVSKGQSWMHFKESRSIKQPAFHPWGFQVASQVREPKDQECLAVVREVHCVLERSMKEVRGIEANSTTSIVEGPLTWRSFYRKAVKSAQEDDSYRPEQIPQILVSADRDPIATSPQLISLWEKLTMGPYDQAKDVLYLAVVPDSNVIVEKCKVYLEELSTIYEKCRFGRHVKLATKDAPRDGIIRVNMKSSSVAHVTAQGLGANNKFNEEDRKSHLKISAFCEQVLVELKAAIVNNEAIFERRAYYETLYRDSLQPNYTSLATSTDSNYMPPPIAPMIQSPPSILSTASGPASQLNPMSNPPPTNSSLFSTSNTNQLPSPALSSSDNLMEPLKTPEVSIGTPGDSQQQQQQQVPSSQHLSLEAIEKAVDEMLFEDHPLSLPHLIVIYLVNPFTFGSETCSSRVSKSSGLFLMKTFNSLLAAISPRRRPQVQIELINLQTLYDYSSFVADPLREERQLLNDMSRNDKPTAYDCLKRVAFSVYSQTRLLIPEHVRSAIPSSMTRFGPASAMSDILDDLQRRDSPLYFKVPTMPFVLAPMEVLGVETSNNRIRLLNPAERVLFVSYCLPSDEFLCAAITDQHGHLSDNVVINLHVDQPSSQLRYKNRSQIFDAIHRLWLFIQSVLAMETRNWRLVICRVGKIGHGEFKAWSQILSKNSIRSFNSLFKGRDRGDALISVGLESASSVANCRTCHQTAGNQEVPIILSACLLSMEAEPNLRLFSSSNSAVDSSASVGKSKNALKNSASQAQIVEDSSITHIVAFPISPDIMDVQHGGNQQPGQEDENMFEELNFDMMDELMNDGENIDQIMGNTDFDDGTRGDATIDHQPMAVGYIVSTAPANDLPDWFWSTCPSMKRQLPVHLKNSLHINSSNIHDELSIGQKIGNETYHPLDDSATDVLLRHIMKVHNSLSWLNVDVANGSRHSCLPVHMQTLFRLQRTVETICS